MGAREEHAMAKAPSWRTAKGSSTERGYGYAWQQARLRFLAANPLCAMCTDDGRVTVATVVNHKVPHRGDQELFWSEENWEALCKRHHDSDAQMAEKSGRVRAKFDGSGRVVW